MQGCKHFAISAATLLASVSVVSSTVYETENPAPGTNWYRKAAGVGSWGGTCLCPDGNSYRVGDNKDFCESLACEGGTPSACEEVKDNSRKKYKVTCAEAICTCAGGSALEGDACTTNEEACESCNPGFRLEMGLCKQNVCNCEAGIPAQGADCHTHNETVCVACTEFGVELQKSDGLETGTCEVVVQELCDCPHGTGAEGIECTIQDDLVLGWLDPASWTPDQDRFDACSGSAFDKVGALSLIMAKCEADADPIVAWSKDIPDEAKQVVVTFKYLEECAGQGVPLAVVLSDDAETDKFTWCLQTDDGAAQDTCDYTFPKEEPVNSEHTFSVSFHKYYERYGAYPADPKLGLLVKGDGKAQTTQVLNVNFVKAHFFKNEEDDVCTECTAAGYYLVKHVGQETGFCQAKCSCEEGIAAEGEDCIIPAEVCSTCTTPGFALFSGTCEATCSCSGGHPAEGLACAVPGEVCVTCFDGFELVDGACKAAPVVEPGPVESMPSGAAAKAPSVAQDAIGSSSLPTKVTSRIGSFSVACVASFVLVGMFIGLRAWQSHRYSGSEAAFLTQELSTGDETGA